MTSTPDSDADLTLKASQAPATLLRVTLLIVLPAILAATLAYLGTIVLPLLIAVFLLFALTPAASMMQRWGVPELLAYFGALVLVMGTLVVFGLLLYVGLGSLEDKLPAYEDQAKSWANELAEGTPLEMSAEDLAKRNQEREFRGEVALLAPQIDWSKTDAESLLSDLPKTALEWAFGSLSSFFGNLLMIVLYLVFLVLEQHALPGRIRLAYPAGLEEKTSGVALRVAEGVRAYIKVKTWISLGTGLGAGLILFVLGVDLWLVWAILTFLFNYLPYIGSLIASAPPILITFLQYDFGWRGFAVAILLIGNQQIWGSLIEPRITGSRLDLSALLLLIGLAYFGMIWGVMGMILAVPLLLAARELLACFPSTRPLAILMSGSAGEAVPEPASPAPT